ncbi:unnamed protein product [Cyprideis torosa]|uniref:WD repeat-containing protein 37 n=1 Tax=Cyprideis torosa TaxID=163714 RepID=A0A7R8W7I4_9CRUS|nr:unnamed protein product [Cyprideis torosa]CAG0887570.1 unnamed protein product [Cyprideis torosa]
MVREYADHKDGLWDIAVTSGSGSVRTRSGLVGSACADMRAVIWDVEIGRILAQYTGHSGSVNSIRFMPGGGGEVLLTGSGDRTAHLWKLPAEHQRQISSEEELEQSDEDTLQSQTQGLLPSGPGGTSGSFGMGSGPGATVSNPLLVLRGHSGVVVAVDAFSQTSFDEGKILTASWDRTANLYDGNTGDIITSLLGHDGELTYVRVHPNQRLAVTASKDTTFRLWDFRESIHSVSVFQGHTDAVNSAVFTQEDKVVSGSEDRTVKVWDLRNMRSPVAAIQLDSAVNRLAVNGSGVIAIPHDNRHIRLYDTQGNRLARLPRNDRTGHRRMVTAAVWAEDPEMTPNLFTSAFDRRICGWKVTFPKD